MADAFASSGLEEPDEPAAAPAWWWPRNKRTLAFFSLCVIGVYRLIVELRRDVEKARWVRRLKRERPAPIPEVPGIPVTQVCSKIHVGACV